MYSSNFPTNFENKIFLVTGGAGFIGSNLVAFLIRNKVKEVRVLDNFSTGYKSNIEEFMAHPAFKLYIGDITILEDCIKATSNVDFVLHHAALGSVPRSIADPIATNNTNINGFLNMLHASVRNNVKRFVYASSSSVYGNDTDMPKKEDKTGSLLSPYAVTKKSNELYADVFYKTYGLEVIGLRYFNVFGPKQNINGPYAAVIPIFINELLNNRAPKIFGDGSTTRDFTFIENVIQANLLAALTDNKGAINQVCNIAFGGTTSLNELFSLIAKNLNSEIKPDYQNERKGDIKDSFADISKAKSLLNYKPEIEVLEGLKRTVAWYKDRF